MAKFSVIIETPTAGAPKSHRESLNECALINVALRQIAAGVSNCNKLDGTVQGDNYTGSFAYHVSKGPKR